MHDLSGDDLVTASREIDPAVVIECEFGAFREHPFAVLEGDCAGARKRKDAIDCEFAAVHLYLGIRIDHILNKRRIKLHQFVNFIF